jgi:hypothetical protein
MSASVLAMSSIVIAAGVAALMADGADFSLSAAQDRLNVTGACRSEDG